MAKKVLRIGCNQIRKEWSVMLRGFLGINCDEPISSEGSTSISGTHLQSPTSRSETDGSREPSTRMCVIISFFPFPPNLSVSDLASVRRLLAQGGSSDCPMSRTSEAMI